MYHYAVKRGQFSIDFYLNIINKGELGRFFIVFRLRVEDNTLFGCIYLFGAIVNPLTHELLIYAKPLAFMISSTNTYGCIFYLIYLLPWLAITFVKILVLRNSGDVVAGSWITSTYLRVYEKVCCHWINEDLLE